MRSAQKLESEPRDSLGKRRIGILVFSRQILAFHNNGDYGHRRAAGLVTELHGTIATRLRYVVAWWWTKGPGGDSGRREYSFD